MAKQTDTNIHDEPTLLEWQAPRQPRFKRGRNWYGFAGLIAGALLTHGVWTGNWLFVFILGFCAYLYMRETRPSAPAFMIRLNKTGITIAERAIPWENCRTVWILALPEQTQFHMELQRGVLRHEIVLIPESVDLAKLKTLLREYTTLDESRTEGKLDMFIRFLKI